MANYHGYHFVPSSIRKQFKNTHQSILELKSGKSKNIQNAIASVDKILKSVVKQDRIDALNTNVEDIKKLFGLKYPVRLVLQLIQSIIDSKFSTMNEELYTILSNYPFSHQESKILFTKTDLELIQNLKHQGDITPKKRLAGIIQLIGVRLQELS